MSRRGRDERRGARSCSVERREVLSRCLERFTCTFFSVISSILACFFALCCFCCRWGWAAFMVSGCCRGSLLVCCFLLCAGSGMHGGCEYMQECDCAGSSVPGAEGVPQRRYPDRPTMMHVIRGRTRLGHRVPREGGAPKVGFPVRPKICAMSQRVGAGVNFRPVGRVREQVAGFTSWEATRCLVPGQTRDVWSLLPSTRRFLILCLCHLDQTR